ncbi:unnamed protein product [Blepharisma stoltei]|uniref:Response regulatory domain-containing protein n=1 Tax=Blepharisma stoltei TaxID=1481888 RepID=A0AAU9JNJ4_9CILI|nr:unnamed protein product [Blepharisma stoltei]
MVSFPRQNSNLYYQDQYFEQNKYLQFKDSSTEKRYSSDIIKSRANSLTYICVWSIAIALCLFILGDITLYEFFSFFSACLPWLAARNSSPLLQRILLEIPNFMILSKIISNGNFFESLAGFLSSFIITLLLYPHWTKFLLFSTMEIIVLFFTNHLKNPGVILTAFTYTLIFSLGEKDFRALWRIYQTMKKSNATYYSFFQNLHSAVFIVNSSGSIIQFNKKAAKMMARMCPNSRNFIDMFFLEYRELIELLIKNAILKGCPGKEELLFKQFEKDIEFSKGEILGCSIYAESIKWKAENCALLMCDDITDNINNKALMMRYIRDSKPAVEAFGKSLANDIDNTQLRSKENFQEYMNIKYYYYTCSIYQSVFFNSIVLSKDSFSIDDDIQNTIEILYGKAQRKSITVTYQKDQGIPKSVIGDQSIHFYILQTTFAFAIEKALPNSEIYLRAEISSAVGKELYVSYTLVIRTRKLNSNDVKKLFHVKRTERQRISMDEIVENCVQSGFGIALFDSILVFLKGEISEAAMEDYGSDKFSLIWKIPYSLSDKAAKSKIIRITANQTYETPLTSKWKPQPENRIDECQQLSNQIIRLRSRGRDSFSMKFEMQTVGNISIESIHHCSTFSSFDVSDLDENPDIAHKICSYRSKEVIRVVTFDPAQYETNFKEENPKKCATQSIANRKIRVFSKNNAPVLPDYSLTSIFKINRFLEKEAVKYKLDPQRMKILVVDDIDSQREIIEEMTEKMFHASYDSAKDGSMAIEMFKAYEDQGYIYQLIFMDVYMPLTDGFKATQQIRDIEKQKGMPRTFICGMSGDAGLRQKCLNVGMDEFLQKPSCPADLKRIVELSRINKF